MGQEAYPVSVRWLLPWQRQCEWCLSWREPLPWRTAQQDWHGRENAPKLVAMALGCGLRSCFKNMCVFRVRGPAPSVGLLFFPGSSTALTPDQAPARCALGTHQQLLTGKDDHVHAPEDAHDPAHHNDGREHLNEGRSDIQPEDAAHVPVWEVGACPTQHGESRDECTWERPEGITSEEAARPSPPPAARPSVLGEEPVGPAPLGQHSCLGPGHSVLPKGRG